MPRQIQGSQWDFSFGEVDVALKRADSHPARKAGLRQMANARILNSGAIQNRSGRRALFPITGGKRAEKFTISAGHNFEIVFGAGRIQILSDVGAVVATFNNKGSGAPLPWATQADINSIVYDILGLQIFICFGHSMRPQVVSWDGASTWTIADYTELVIGNQKRTPFYRISPRGIGIQPSDQTGATITVTASNPIFTAAWAGTRIRFVNRQILINSFIDSTHLAASVEETLPGSQTLNFASDPHSSFSVGDVVTGSVSGAKGQVLALSTGNVIVQLLSNTTSSFVSETGNQNILAFVGADIAVGPGGGLQLSSANSITPPETIDVWDEEVMNDFRGYPASCFVDQFRLGFCDFPSVPGGIAWSAINSPFDLYVDVNPDNAMFEIAPAKTRVLYVVPGAESSEFVFCDTKLYYIPISPTNPLKPGSVQFQVLSGDGCAPVQPRLSQEVIIYANAGQSSVMAVVATGAFYRPFNTKALTEYHSHLFDGITAIAIPTADGQFNERYAYVLNGDGSLVVGKYNMGDLSTDVPKIGWGPWSGAGAISWVSAWNADVLFTSSYFGASICEVLDDSQYLDSAIAVNAAPAAFAPPLGKGPLWFIAGQSVTLIDQVTRVMGTYQIDANGFIIPQFNGGEDLTAASLVAGQPWSGIAEPFPTNASSGVDMHQRMMLRSISNFAVYVINSTGFEFASLFSAKQTPTSPPLGTIMNTRRVPAYNVGDDATKPPIQRETVETWSPQGGTYDPRAAIIWDTPGPLLIAEFGMEISI